MTLCTIALGGNLGPVSTTFREALARLDTSETKVTAVSGFHNTTPVGAHAGQTFLNACAQIETTLAPLGLLDRLQAIETALGRTRTLRWGPRTLDLDLIFYGTQVLESPRLIVPHPAAWYRRFVLDPLFEINPDFVHPVKQARIRTLRERLLVRPLPVALTSISAQLRTELAEQLALEIPQVQFVPWDAAAIPQADRVVSSSADSDPALIVWFGQASAPACRFVDLPPMPRLDVSVMDDPPLETTRGILNSALGT